MKKIILTLLLLSPLVVSAGELSQQEAAALMFNQWYMGQLLKDKSPLTDYKTLGEYVTSDTIRALKELNSGDSNDKDMPDADMFIKAQDYDNDCKEISVISSDFDAACTNVYIAFGKNKNHVVADCMVQNAGKWKVRSVTLIK